MDSLVNVSIFFAASGFGLGFFFIGCATLYAVSVWAKKREEK